jgi:hypothetical protein
MAKPTLAVRLDTYDRDGERCVSCGTRTDLQYQHRRAEGMGGREKAPAICDGLTSCTLCNPGYEGPLQRVALRYGWKTRSWVSDRSRVPVWYPLERSWFRLLRRVNEAGELRVRVSHGEAMAMMRDVYGPAWDDEKGLVG